VEVLQRYSNLDTVQKTLQMLQSAGLISPDGRVVEAPDRTHEQVELARPFKLDQRLKPEMVAEIVARYETGEPSTTLAAVFGISKGSVIRLLRDSNVTIRNQRLTDDQIAEATQLYDSGLSLAKIGAMFGVDHGTVWRALKKRGVRMRDSHGRER
jgi:transposase-like protein